jgi:hypothetical protein
MSVVVDKERAIQLMDFNNFPGRNNMQTVEFRLSDIALYLQDMPKKKVSSLITIPVATATTNNQLANFIPAGSLVTSLGVFFTEACDPTSNGVLSVGFGNASADVSIVASTALNIATENIVINSFTSTTSKHFLTSSGTAANALKFAVDSALYFDNESDLFFQTIVATNVLSATCGVKVTMEYISTTNS